MFFSNLSKYSDLGLLFIRIIFGSMFLYYGYPKLFGGVAMWGQIGQAMGSVGVSIAPVFWGFMASISMFLGGICVLLGLFIRPACMFLAFTMFVATTMHFRKGDGLSGASHALEVCSVFLGLVFIGPGKYSIDALLWGK